MQVTSCSMMVQRPQNVRLTAAGQQSVLMRTADKISVLLPSLLSPAQPRACEYLRSHSSRPFHQAIILPVVAAVLLLP